MMATHSKRENICQPNPEMISNDFNATKLFQKSLIQTKRLKTINFRRLTENLKKCKVTIITIISVFSSV